jgi:hypothetical protein
VAARPHLYRGPKGNYEACSRNDGALHALREAGAVTAMINRK